MKHKNRLSKNNYAHILAKPQTTKYRHGKNSSTTRQLSIHLGKLTLVPIQRMVLAYNMPSLYDTMLECV